MFAPRLLAIAAITAATQALGQPADLVLVNGAVTTQDAAAGDAEAFAVRDGVFVQVGTNEQVESLIGAETTVIDARGRRVIPGLNDSHIHATRAGRFYHTELPWGGVTSLARGLDMIRLQAKRTPEGQWVRVVGGWSPYQFEERRLPTPAELTAAAPDTPVFVLCLYSQGFLNAAGVKALGIDASIKAPPGCRYELTPDGGAILHAEPSPILLYQTVAALPALSHDDQINSSLYFYRDLNRFGITSVVDPGGGGHLYPDDYFASDALSTDGRLAVRVGKYLFASVPGGELDQYKTWTSRDRIGVNRAVGLLEGYTVDGAGENLAFSAADFENFLAPRPELPERMEDELAAIVRFLVEKRWPIRIHATYDESIRRMLDVFERVNRDTPFNGLRVAFDHTETMKPDTLKRLAALGCGVAVQNRMSYAGEFFANRYGWEAAQHAPALRQLVDAGIPVGGGTDASRVANYNPWLSLHWMVTGKTLGGMKLFADDNSLTRAEALFIYTVGSAWFTHDEDAKGRIASGQYADFAVLSDDFFTVPEADINSIESVLTVVAGRPVYASDEFASAVNVPALPPISPAWSPVAVFGGYQQSTNP